METPAAGSAKTRIVVTLGADEATGAGGEVVGWVTLGQKSGANALLSPGADAEGAVVPVQRRGEKVAPADGRRVEAPSRG